MNKRIISFIILISISLGAYAQVAREYVDVVVSPDHSDWVYKVGEGAEFTLFAIKENVKMPNAVISYQWGAEKLAATFKGEVKTDKNGEARIKVPGAKAPGFVTVSASTEVDGVKYSDYTTIGFDPEKIQPTTTLPADFKEFWDKAKADAAAVPMTIQMTQLPDKSNDRVDVYNVKVQSYRVGTYVYGVLTVPKGEGPFPAVLRLPGASVRGFSGPNSLAYNGVIVFEIGIHGIPVNQDPEIYLALQSGVLAGYSSINLDNRDKFYYKRVYMGCVRAIDFLFTLKEFDKDRLAVYGGSQGGQLSIVTASLDSRVKYMVCHYPAFSDVTGYYNGRAGGWPHLFTNKNEDNIQKKIEVSRYYDTANFARSINIPGYYAWGFNDLTCCPTSTYSAYNVIKAEKRLELALDAGHWLYPWHVNQGVDWLMDKFDTKK